MNHFKNLVWILALAISGNAVNYYPDNHGIMKRENLEKNSKKLTLKQLVKLRHEILYEYCIKIILVCHLIWDAPMDYEDEDEPTIANPPEVLSEHISNFLAGVQNDFIKAKCIPSNLSPQKKKRFWLKIRRWEVEVRKQFLNQGIFILKEELDDGKAIKINLWNVFKISKTVICNRTKDFGDLTDDSSHLTTPGEQSTKISTVTIKDHEVTSEATPKSCNKYSTTGRWVFRQVNRTLKLIHINNKIVNTLDKLKRYTGRNCCLYEPVRDRIEVINDNIGTIMQISNIKSSEQENPSWSMWLDFENIRRRLEYLNHKKIHNNSNNNCCPQWSEKFQKIQLTFQTQLKNHPKLNGSIQPALDVLHQGLVPQYLKELQRYNDLEKLYNNSITIGGAQLECCRNHDKALNEIDATNYINTIEAIFQKVFTNIFRAGYIIQNTSLVFKIDERQTIKLEAICDKLRKKNKQQPDTVSDGNETSGMEIKLNVLISQAQDFKSKAAEEKLNKKVKDAINKLQKINERLKELDETFHGFEKSSQAPGKSDITANSTDFSAFSYCLNIIEELTTYMQQLNLLYNKNYTKHRDTQPILSTLINDLFAKLKKLEAQLENARQHRINMDLQMKNSLAKLLKDLESEIKIFQRNQENKSELQSTQTEQLEIIKVKTNDNLTAAKRSIDESVATENKTNNRIDHKINDLGVQFPKTLQESKNYNEINPKLGILETEYVGMLKNEFSLSQKMMDRIKHLRNIIDNLNSKLKNAETEIEKCNQDCNLPDTPFIDEMLQRLEMMELKLKNEIVKKNAVI